MRVCLSSRLSWRLFWNVRRSWRSFPNIRQSASFSLLLLSDLLSSLYWPWDPLSFLESTPVSILVPKQVDCNMCRFSKLLLFSFFFCKDGSDRLMKRASFSCCNFLCVVLAAAYLKYRRCRLLCLPFVWHFFFIVTHTHTHTHTQTDLTQNHKKWRSLLTQVKNILEDGQMKPFQGHWRRKKNIFLILVCFLNIFISGIFLTNHGSPR